LGYRYTHRHGKAFYRRCVLLCILKIKAKKEREQKYIVVVLGVPKHIQTLNLSSTHTSKSFSIESNSIILSHIMQGGPLLAETRTNGKRGRGMEIGIPVEQRNSDRIGISRGS
jgi:hypothetical protein